MRIASSGHAVFAGTMIAIGVLGVVQGDFTPTWSGVPTGVPARVALAYLCAFISLESGIIVGHPSASDWTEFISSWVLTASAWVVADSYRGQP